MSTCQPSTKPGLRRLACGQSSEDARTTGANSGGHLECQEANPSFGGLIFLNFIFERGMGSPKLNLLVTKTPVLTGIPGKSYANRHRSTVL
jgi:hypothetical protein